MHTGVITNNSTSGSDWKYVKFDWGVNDPSVQATSLGNNKWEYTFSPNVRDFYGVTDPNEVIEQIAIVFKGVENGSVVAEGKDTGNSDIFVDLYSAEPMPSL